VSAIYLHEALCVSYLKVKNYEKSLNSGNKVLALKKSYLGESHEEVYFLIKFLLKLNLLVLDCIYTEKYRCNIS